MIYGEIKELNNYRGLSKAFDTAIDYILAGKYRDGKIGKNIVDGDTVYFNCPDSPKTKDEKDGFFEAHKKYIDIHIVIEGDENIGYFPASKAKVSKEYDAAGDCEILDGKAETFIHLNNGRFLALFPGEPHMALIKHGEHPGVIKKVIFKILAE
ncbi:YhcH/YjgK/YiaL family protein [Fusobacterium sp.]|uniref:YhcH/YjgK/YiaL family protein n=1 Tax=Fusobacterium sp. TaxID=68766 RepID=UPI00396CA483